jgi:hypothetical protein
MRARALTLLIFAAAFLTGGCGGSDRDARVAAMGSREAFVNDVIERRCIKCHVPPNPSGKAILTEPAHLVKFINSDQIFDDMALYNSIMGGTNIPEHNRQEFQPTQAEMDTIRTWVLVEYKRMFPDSVLNEAQNRGITDAE